MRFRLLEKEISQAASQAEADKFISKNCQQFLRESKGKSLYRGVSSEKPAIFFASSGKSRRSPKDTPIEIHNLFDSILMDKFGWGGRSYATFVTGTSMNAEYYGPVYEIYPADGYKFIWSPDIHDFYSDYDYFIHGIGKYTHNRNIDYPNFRPNKDAIEDHIYEISETYRSDNLLEAIQSGNEIMLHSEKYAAIWDGE